ncbi:antibiotic biosynthesis monooxygenase [Natronosporangium hydrolyticum]|uniref:Antibiotic biosynthesis monooxygenase n=1 Tax=Natronosporangium hydrolyticum TaxID=2811111 RepID=A0A895YMM1_9ACTN|nr:antibiotic biosynthesis monooxygenase family protein [Natronosporangium hydrolyticum]QSB15936.1 antibiotic biosynthesis monooxygenase [Natronosporangium hydrolyticum]
MPIIQAHDGFLTVFNMFTCETLAGQDTIVEEMKQIVDNAAYPGWISSTVHAGCDSPGTANYIQWRSLADLEARYAGADYQNATVPLFQRISTSVALLKTEVVFSQHHPDLDQIEISPLRDDYTVIIVMDVEPANQPALVDALGRPDHWLMEVAGYRSHAICRGIDGTFLILYAQWENKQHYDAFHHLPEHRRPAEVRQVRAFADTVITGRRANTYRVVHSRSAAAVNRAN